MEKIARHETAGLPLNGFVSRPDDRDEQGSRLTDRAQAAGDSPAGASEADERPCPPGRQRSASFGAITARQLHALVRRHVLADGV